MEKGEEAGGRGWAFEGHSHSHSHSSDCRTTEATLTLKLTTKEAEHSFPCPRTLSLFSQACVTCWWEGGNLFCCTWKDPHLTMHLGH